MRRMFETCETIGVTCKMPRMGVYFTAFGCFWSVFLLRGGLWEVSFFKYTPRSGIEHPSSKPLRIATGLPQRSGPPSPVDSQLWQAPGQVKGFAKEGPRPKAPNDRGLLALLEQKVGLAIAPRKDVEQMDKVPLFSQCCCLMTPCTCQAFCSDWELGLLNP